MKTISIVEPLFFCDGRGPIMTDWITKTDLLLPGAARGIETRTICGASYQLDEESAWVIFYGQQVIQIVPEEVHSYWQFNYREPQQQSVSGIWLVEDSQWLKTFSPRHLDNHKHYILTFYDELVEVICRELIFGSGRFNMTEIIDKEPRFYGEYIYRACTYESKQMYREAVADLKKYLKLDPNGSSSEYARRSIQQYDKF